MTTPPDAALLNALRGAVRAEIQPLFAEMQRLFDRRIAELGAELHASMELVDVSEVKPACERQAMREQIAGSAAIIRNSEVELAERLAAATGLHLVEPAARGQAEIDGLLNG